MTAIEAFVRRHRAIGLDTNILIGMMEAHADYHPTITRLFEAFVAYEPRVYVSVITIPEILIRPLRHGRSDLVRKYERWLSQGIFRFANVDVSVAHRAVELGGQSRLRTLDALVLTSVIAQGATGFVTADHDFRHATQTVDILAVKWSPTGKPVVPSAAP